MGGRDTEGWVEGTKKDGWKEQRRMGGRNTEGRVEGTLKDGWKGH